MVKFTWIIFQQRGLNFFHETILETLLVEKKRELLEQKQKWNAKRRRLDLMLTENSVKSNKKKNHTKQNFLQNSNSIKRVSTDQTSSIKIPSTQVLILQSFIIEILAETDEFLVIGNNSKACGSPESSSS